MQRSGLNNNKLRKIFWETMLLERTAGEIEAALDSLHPADAKVLRWHYGEGRDFTEIASLLGRSLSTVRNHQARGLFRLQQYFVN